jgi:hypothetical protein
MPIPIMPKMLMVFCGCGIENAGGYPDATLTEESGG